MVKKCKNGGILSNTHKGFTLIELLAVVVLLSVIALITIPIISNILNNVKLKAFQTKIYALEKAAKTYYEEIIEEDEEVFKKGIDGIYTLTIDLSDKEQTKRLKIKTFNKGMLTITENGNILITAIENKYCGQKLHSSNVINMLDINNDFSCYLLNSSSNNLETSDILTAIQNLKDSNENLINSNKELQTKVESLEETVKNLSDKGVGTTQALNKIYPVGSIYISTTLNTKEKVKEALGGEWESYGDGRVLRGTISESGKTGGLSTVSLTTANLPEHSHSYTPIGSVSSTFTGSSETTSSDGIHGHISFYMHGYSGWTGNVPRGYYAFNWTDVVLANPGINALTGYSNPIATSYDGTHTHTVTAKGSVSSTFTGTKSNTSSTGSNTAFSVLDPYITVYMYKRVS